VEFLVMRKFLISLLAASALVPAAAQAEDGAILSAMRSHAERSSQNDNKSDTSSSASPSSHRVERSNDDRPARTDRTSRPDRQSGVERVERAGGGDRNDRGTGRIERAWRAQRTQQDQQQVEVTQPPSPVRSREQTEGRRDGLAGAFGRAGRDMADGRTGDRDNDGDWRRDRDGHRDGDRDWRRDGDNHHRWSRDWRRNSRYDWYGYRNHYRSLFRLGRYYDPYGWGYRRFSIGFDLWPSYYGSSFWLDDPWQYRLPPAYGPYRWIRYYDDALLVNIYTGEVVDVVYNVFW
jgi:Ni/Co efflux regulator RcnB